MMFMQAIGEHLVAISRIFISAIPLRSDYKAKSKRQKSRQVIRGLKSAVSKFAHENNIPFAWQSRFYDYIFRKQEKLNATAK